MEDLKKKIMSMTPYNAFLAHAGIALLILVLFLFVSMAKPKTPKADNMSYGGIGAYDFSDYDDYDFNFRDYGYDDYDLDLFSDDVDYYGQSVKGAEPTFTGGNILFGKHRSQSFGTYKLQAKVTFGTASIFCWIGCLALLISVIYAWTKKIIDWRISALALVGMFIGALTMKMKLTASATGVASESMELDATPTALYWILVVAIALWVAFGYFRGNSLVSFKQK